ncbi:MAG: hypothetical protein WBZ29_08770 [Methanocella sp.]
MKAIKGAFALFILTGFFLALSVNFFAPAACGHADFDIWANRSARVCEPCNYANKGSSAEKIVSWNGTGGIGNVGIGNGNYTLMKPDFINDAVKSMENSTMANEPATPGNITANNVTRMPQDNARGNSSLISNAVATGGEGQAPATCPTCNKEAPPASEESLTESLTPDYIMAGGVIREGTPYSVTIGRPFPHILNEEPVELGVLYAKMFGLPMPDGSRIDIGVKSPGYEY